MKIRMDIPDELYNQYKELAEKQGFAVTKLNQILFTETLEKWIAKAFESDKVNCTYCGKISHVRSGRNILVKKGEDSIGRMDVFFVCNDCYYSEIEFRHPGFHDDEDEEYFYGVKNNLLFLSNSVNK